MVDEGAPCIDLPTRDRDTAGAARERTDLWREPRGHARPDPDTDKDIER